MKYSHFIICFLLILSADISSQESSKLNYQLNAGTSISIPYKKSISTFTHIENHPRMNYSSAFGYFIEAMVSYDLNETFLVMTGINYNHNTLDFKEKAGAFEINSNISSSYIDIPIMFGLKLGDMSLSAGPYLGFVISAKEKGTSFIDTTGLITMDPDDSSFDEIETTQHYDRDNKRHYKPIVWGLAAQIDYEFKLTYKLKGVLLTRLNYELTSVIKKDQSMNLPDNWKDSSVMVGFGVKL
ncbi:MAG: PorT family protein [Bacteroidales bacterium]|nr:PorT family protein [Bacteroidales bacterium]